MLALLAAPSLAQAFDPDANNDSATTTRTPTSYRAKLPSTAPLMTTPNYAPLNLSPIAAQAAPVANAPAIADAPAIAPAPVEYTPVAAAAPVAPAAAPHYPPVDPAVAAQAQREMNAQPSFIAAPPNFTAPAPLPAQVAAPVTATPAIAAPAVTKPAVLVVPPPAPAPVVAAAEPAPTLTYAPDAGLSTASKKILNRLPAKLATPPAPVGGKLAVDRMNPELKPIGEPAAKIESYDAVGLSIKVARPSIDTNFELNRAYNALMGGDSLTAIESYKKILSAEPSNQDALFGLASTYHRNGEPDKARPYYAQLLKENPNHREGLNNFLALVSDESPESALVELERLEQRNPDFSPIPAQESIVLSKLGYFEQARDKLMRAITLAPENLTYKYNLAVLFDRHGDYGQACAIYRMLIDASLNGEKLPATTEVLQKRLNYLTSAAASALAVSGN